MLFLLWFCSPLPRRGLLVRVRFLVKGRVCRSPFCVKFLTLHSSLFGIITHSPNFMILLTPPQNVGKHSLSKPITFVLSLQSSFFLHLCQNEVLLKRGFWVFTGCICLILSCPTLTSRECICLSAEWLKHGSECSYQQEYLGSVFQWNQESKDPNHTAILKGKDIAEFIQKKNVVSKISASLHQFQLALFSHLFSHFDWLFYLGFSCTSDMHTL